VPTPSTLRLLPYICAFHITIFPLDLELFKLLWIIFLLFPYLPFFDKLHTTTCNKNFLHQWNCSWNCMHIRFTSHNNHCKLVRFSKFIVLVVLWCIRTLPSLLPFFNNVLFLVNSQVQWSRWKCVCVCMEGKSSNFLLINIRHGARFRLEFFKEEFIQPFFLKWISCKNFKQFIHNSWWFLFFHILVCLIFFKLIIDDC
jgi:hypothetical protein